MSKLSSTSHPVTLAKAESTVQWEGSKVINQARVGVPMPEKAPLTGKINLVEVSAISANISLLTAITSNEAEIRC